VAFCSLLLATCNVSSRAVGAPTCLHLASVAILLWQVSAELDGSAQWRSLA